MVFASSFSAGRARVEQLVFLNFSPDRPSFSLHAGTSQQPPHSSCLGNVPAARATFCHRAADSGFLKTEENLFT